MKSYTRITVDKEKVKELLEKSEMNATSVSRSIGRNHNFISRLLSGSSTHIGMNDYLFIKEKYGIDIKKKTKVDNDVKKLTDDISDFVFMDRDILQKIITNGILDAFADLSLTEISNFIEQAVYRGVKKALER